MPQSEELALCTEENDVHQEVADELNWGYPSKEEAPLPDLKIEPLLRHRKHVVSLHTTWP